MLALIYLQAWSVLLCTHIYIRMLRGVNTAYGVKGCVSNTACVIIVTHVVTWFYANRTPKSMGYYRVWVLAEVVPGPFFGPYKYCIMFK